MKRVVYIGGMPYQRRNPQDYVRELSDGAVICVRRRARCYTTLRGSFRFCWTATYRDCFRADGSTAQAAVRALRRAMIQRVNEI